MKGGILLSAIGYIQVHAYTSNAQIPLEDTAVSITDSEGGAIALRLTNQSGLLNQPVQITVPNPSASQSPDTGVIPFTSVNIHAKLQNYQEIYVRNVQVFPGTTTFQNLPMIPLSELPAYWNQSESFDTSDQNL